MSSRRSLAPIALIAAIGGLLFGYDTAVISGAIGNITRYFSLTPLEVGWAISSALVGCLVGALLADYLSTRWGRKWSMVIAALLFLISAIGTALLDTFTVREKLGRIEGIHVAIVGDILFSRVARSNIYALTKLGAKVTLVGPSTLVPREFEQLGVQVSHDIDSILPDVDVVNLLRIQHERQRKEYFPSLGEYTSLFGLTKARAQRLKPGALVMHPGPINRGVEIDSEVADSERSVILDQVTNGVAVRMAVLYLCAGGGASLR